jgi:membrane associated rhomboid family serine protease
MVFLIGSLGGLVSYLLVGQDLHHFAQAALVGVLGGWVAGDIYEEVRYRWQRR